MTLEETVDVLNELVDKIAGSRYINALNVAIRAVSTMRDIKKTEDIDHVVTILHDYISGVE